MKHNVKELKIWQKAIDLTVDIYKTTAGFPTEEKYGLTSQIRRSAVSIPSNIAEGAGRNTDKEFLHSLGISNESSFELMTQIIVANRLKFIADDQANNWLNEINEIQKMARGLQSKMTTV